MRKVVLVCLIAASAVLSQPSGLRFPKIQRLGSNADAGGGAWRVMKRVEPHLDGQSIYSFKYHSSGKSLLIGTTDFNIYRINLADGSAMWKVSAAMKYQKEFDGPDIYDVSPDGSQFLSFGQARPEEQASERYLVVRSSENGSVIRKFPVEESLFYSKRADIDYRNPGAEERKRRIEAGIGFNWILTIDSAVFIDGGARILASYKHNMEGPNLYDRRLVIYDARSGKKIKELQLTCDPETANWEQPAGFEIGHVQFPYVYNARNKTLIFGTAHGRVHEMDEAAMAGNMSVPAVEDKAAGRVLYTPLSTSSDMQTKDRQTLRFMALSPDSKTLFASAGFEAGYLQLYAYDLVNKKEIFRSTLFDAGRLIAPSADILVIGGMFSSARFYIVDVRQGRLAFAAGDNGDEYINPSIFAANPLVREVAGLGTGNVIVVLRPGQGEGAW